jgi:hypothetical protein
MIIQSPSRTVTGHILDIYSTHECFVGREKLTMGKLSCYYIFTILVFTLDSGNLLIDAHPWSYLNLTYRLPF